MAIVTLAGMTINCMEGEGILDCIYLASEKSSQLETNKSKTWVYKSD